MGDNYWYNDINNNKSLRAQTVADIVEGKMGVDKTKKN